MFLTDTVTTELATNGIAPDPASLRPIWRDTVQQLATSGTLQIPDTDFAHKGGTTGTHSEHLGYILTEMQWLQRAHPGATW